MGGNLASAVAFLEKPLTKDVAVPRVIAGATEVFLLVWVGQLRRAIMSVVLSMLLGNVIGGSALLAVLSFGQELGEK